jgi:hypothetical protein
VENAPRKSLRPGGAAELWCDSDRIVPVLILGLESLTPNHPGFTAKAVLNQHGIIFFPVNHQHRDRKATNISYEDDYQGNALAAMLSPGRIEIRYHKAFTDEAIADLLGTLTAHPDLAFMRGWSATYQGRPIASL